MLNRRILRAKTMQSVFGALQVRSATFEVAKENIARFFSEDRHIKKESQKTAIQNAKIQEALMHFDGVAALKEKPLTEDLLPESFSDDTKQKIVSAFYKLTDFSKLELARTRRELEAALQVDAFDTLGEKSLLTQAEELFEQLADSTIEFQVPLKTEDRVREAAASALKFLEQNYKEDVKRSRYDLINSCEKLYVHYLTYLNLVIKVCKFAETDEFEKQQRLIRPNAQHSTQLKLATNPVISLLENTPAFIDATIRQGVVEFDLNFIRTIFTDIVFKDPEYQTYSNAEDSELDFEAHRKIVRYLATKVIIKAEIVDGWFEERDLYWPENNDTLRNMVVKTLKGINAEDEVVTLSSLSQDWEDDRIFTLKLFDLTIAQYPTYYKLLATQSDNWDASRFSHTDMVIMVQCLAEIMNFQEIPVRVSINEYLEIAKQYSTPQSHQFINALIDGVVQKLENEGKIKKSGRGLLKA